MGAPKGNKYAEGLTNSGRPPMYNSSEELQVKIIEYFESFADNQEGKAGNKERITITGLCLFLGFDSRQSFYDYEEKKEYSYVVKRARLVIENMYEEWLQTGQCTGSIFALKNMGWSDKTEIEHSGKLQTENLSNLTTEELIQRAEAVKAIEKAKKSE